MRRNLQRLAVVAVALIAAWIGYQAGKRGNDAPPPQDPAALNRLLQAPLAKLDGAPGTLKEWEGKIRVINFWASWCPPCRAEMPAFSRIQQQFSGKNVQFIGIALDAAEPVTTFLRTTPVTYPILLASPALLDLTVPLGNQVQGLPFSIIVDAKGRLAATKLGQWDEAELAGELGRQIQKQ